MNLNIDLNSRIPLYHQLKEQIKQSIHDGKYQEGDLIPSEREFIESYELSSTTVRRALNDLVQENYLERKAGKGTFVKLKKAKRNLRKVLGFTKNMTEMGLNPSTKVISKKIVTANSYACERLGLKKNDKVFELERLRLADGVPMMLEIRYIRLDLCPGIEKEDLNSSLWKVFEEQYGLKPSRHTQAMVIFTVSGNDASLLTLNDNSLVFMIKGVTYVDDEPIECEKSLYRSDKYELSFEAMIE